MHFGLMGCNRPYFGIALQSLRIPLCLVLFCAVRALGYHQSPSEHLRGWDCLAKAAQQSCLLVVHSVMKRYGIGYGEQYGKQHVRMMYIVYHMLLDQCFQSQYIQLCL